MSGLEKKRITAVVSFIISCWTMNTHAQELNLAPDCSQAIASPNKIWPPNYKMVPIDIVGVTDPDDQPITIETQCIVQDEPVLPWRWYRKRYDGSGLSTGSPSVRAMRLRWFFSFEDYRWYRSKGRVYDIIFKATDSQGAMCSGKVNVGIPLNKNKPVKDNGLRFPSLPGGVNCDAQAINNPPIIYSQPVIEAKVNRLYQYPVTGHDPDQDTLSYELIKAPDGMVINAQSGNIEWTPNADHEGVQTVTVQVMDPGGLQATQSYEITVLPAIDELSSAIVANPTSGTSPLTVRFSPDVENQNIVINKYDWDFDGDGTIDVSDSFGAPKTYTYTGSPGDSFVATLTATPASGDPLVATQTITLGNEPPSVQVTTNVSNGHAPLQVTFTVNAQDPQGIDQVNIDFDGDGHYDETLTTDTNTSGPWEFQTTYQNEGNYVTRVKVTDTFGAETVITNNAITVDVNNVLDPIIQLGASPTSGDTPLTVALTATATLFDGSSISQWRWDLDGDGTFETIGGNSETDNQNTTYLGVDYYYPAAEVTTQSGRSVKTSIQIETRATGVPTLSIPDSSDTIDADAAEIATFDVTLPYETDLEIWIENATGAKVKTIQTKQTTQVGTYSFNWDGTDEQNETVTEGDYYVVLGYSQLGTDKEIDLRTTTGGELSYYRRTTANPRQFNRLESPLIINYAVDQPAQVSFFWQISFGARLMTLMEHERLGRGQYSLYWNGEYPSGEKVPDNLNTLMPGILRYALPDNVIFVKSMPRIEEYVLNSTIMADPRREPIGFDITLSKDTTVELIVSDMDKGINVATRSYPNLSAGEHHLSWDGKNNNDQYLAPSDYRMGVRSIDKKGNRSLFWYRTQRINY